MPTPRNNTGEEPTSDTGLNLDQRERQEKIRERVITNGFVRSEALTEEFSVTLMTIHRDLDVLQRQGWLRKIRGGATAQPSALFHGDIRYRMQAMKEAKEKLARTAIKMITHGQSIILDESTTALHLAQLLPEHVPTTVITNFLAIIKLLAGKPGIDLVGLGGSYYPAYDAFLGLHTAESASSLRADILFMSTTAITDGICYHQTQDTIIVKRALIEAAAKRVLLIDHSKSGKRGIFQLTSLTNFDLVIVDDGISKQDLDAMIRLGAKVHIAGTESEDGQELLALLNHDR